MSRYSRLCRIPFDRRLVNGRLLPARNSVNTALIGSPRGDYGIECRDATDHNFISFVWKVSFARKSAWALKPFSEQLKKIDAVLRSKHEDLYRCLSHQETLCCRLVRGSQSVISSHSWGIAIDLTLDGETDTPGDNLVQAGLLEIAPVFIAHGLYWGIAFPREEAMHFEASEQLVRLWAQRGMVRGAHRGAGRDLQYGDRSLAVEQLQIALNRLLEPSSLIVDGQFGRDTRNAVIEAHVRLGMAPVPQASSEFLKNLCLEGD